MPVETLRRLEEIKHTKVGELLDQENAQIFKQDLYRAQKQLFGVWDTELDTSTFGPHWLAEDKIADLVCDSLKYRDGLYFTLEAYCIMPNHVHLLMTPLPIDGDEQVYPLFKIMQSLKGYTARYANKVLNRQGEFWQHESYDHVVRDSDEFGRIVHYIMQNPVRAGLPPRWVYCRTSG